MTTVRSVPPLESGDRLTRPEFHRRYSALPHVKKAELIEGIVYMPAPVPVWHGEAHADVGGWVMQYVSRTAGVEAGSSSSVWLDNDNEPQPDVLLRIEPGCGGQSRTVDGFVDGAPELVAEVAASRVSRELHDKLRAYRRNGVREYVVLRVFDGEVDWFVQRGGAFERLLPDAAGLVRSECFPGLWLDVPALLRDDLRAVAAAVEAGCATPEHEAFVQRLTRAASPGSP